MTIRNSLKSILRTPVKTSLFTFLIAAVTMFLYLGINTFVSGLTMLQDCNDHYSTIVTLEFQEDYGAEGAQKSKSFAEDVESIDFDAIADNQNALYWQPANRSVASVAGFTSRSTNSEYSAYCIFVITRLRPYIDGSTYHGIIVDTLYSKQAYNDGYSIFIENAVANMGFVPDSDETYVIIARNQRLGSPGLVVKLTSFYIGATGQGDSSIADIPKILPIESLEDFYAQEDNPYLEIANYLNFANHALNVCYAQAAGDLKEFHQQTLLLISGQFFTKAETDRGEKQCVISKTVADKVGVEVGDILTLLLPTEEEEGVDSRLGSLFYEEHYTVAGIFDYHEDYHLNVYLSAPEQLVQPTEYTFHLGQATVESSKASKFLTQIEPLLPDSIYAAVYDQGYHATASSIQVIIKASGVLSLIALAVTLAVLAFFAHQYSDTRREMVETMGCFGAKKKEIRCYLVFGISLISLVAIGTGIAAGIGYADSLMNKTYQLIAEMQIVDIRYSDGYRGIVKEFTPAVTLSYALAIWAGIGIFALSLALCLYYADKTISGRLITAKARARILKEPEKSSVALRGWLRHAVLSIRRSGVRSALVPLLSAVALLFVSFLQATLLSYDRAQEELHQNTRLQGYFAHMSGKPSGKLYIDNGVAKKFLEVEDIGDIFISYAFDYQYMGIYSYNAVTLEKPKQDEGEGEGGEEEPVPETPADLDPSLLKSLNNTLVAEAKLIFTNSVEDAPEFLGNTFHGKFMAGMDMSRFLDRNWTEPCCIIPEQFAIAHGIQLGDIITLEFKHYTFDHMIGTEIDLLVAGSFTQAATKSNIYCPLPMGALDPESSYLNLLSENLVTPETGRYHIYAKEFAGIYVNYAGDEATAEQIKAGEVFRRLAYEKLTIPYQTQQFLDIVLDSRYLSSITFRISDTQNLSRAKDALETAGYSGPAMPRELRNCIVIEDSRFTEALRTLTQRSQYLQILYPILIALVCLLGLITGYLSIHSRREDIALMRGIGVRKRRIFATVFGEQILLLSAGLLPAALLWLIVRDAAQLTATVTYGFFLCYALGSVFSALQQNVKKALVILSEKE